MAMPLTLNSWHCTFATRRLEEETSSYTSVGVSCFIRQKEMAAVSLLVLPLLRLWVRSWISGCWPVRDELAPGRNHFPKRNYGQNWPLAHAQCSMPNAGRITQLRSPPIPVPPRQFPTTWGVRFSDRVVEWVSVGLVWVSGGHSPSQNRTKAKTKAKKWAKVHTTPHTHSPTHPHTHTHWDSDTHLGRASDVDDCDADYVTLENVLRPANLPHTKARPDSPSVLVALCTGRKKGHKNNWKGP